MKKQIGYIGLGKMGANMAERLVEKGWRVVAYDPSEEARVKAQQAGVEAVGSIGDMIAALEAPRLVWLMVPHAVVEEVLAELLPLLEPADTVIDGGNSFYKESMRRGKAIKARGINFLDVGVSGGQKAARNGSCIMVGGEREVFEHYEELFHDLAVDHGYKYLGRSGAGHFVKMVHNGIEYGMMQAIAEGFAVMKQSEFDLDLREVADIYNHGSIIESRLIGWTRDAFDDFGADLDGVSGEIGQNGEGLWTSEAAKEKNISVPVIDASLAFRNQSQGNPSFTGQVVSALRNKFGGHQVRKKEHDPYDILKEGKKEV